MTLFLASLAEIAAALEITPRAVRKRAQKQSWACLGETLQGGGRRYNVDELPLSDQEKTRIRAHLLLCVRPGSTVFTPEAAAPEAPAAPPGESRPTDEDREALWNYAAQKSAKNREGAARKAEAVRAVESLMARGTGITAACNEVGAKIGKGGDRVRVWFEKTRGVDPGDWVAILVDARGGNRPKKDPSPEVYDYIKADWLRIERPTFQAVYERAERAAKAHGWELPSLKTIKRKLENEIPHALIVLKRQGEDAYKKCYPAQERDKTVFRALEAVNGDGYTFFKYVRFESGEVCRPTAWVWQDIYSGKILAWRLDVSENKDQIRLSIGDLIEHYGIPSYFLFDSTRAAANKDVTGGVKNRYRFKVMPDEPLGLIPQLGAAVHWATPGHGQAKPVERCFGVGGLGEHIDKHPAFSGRGTQANPIPVEEFEAIMTAEIAAYNARRRRRSKVCNGKSFDEVFAESYAKGPIRKATREQRALWLLAPEPVTANAKDGSIKIMGNRYWCEELTRYKGKKLVARFDPANMHKGAIVYQLDGRRIGEAECILPAGFNDRNAAREVAKQKARRKKALREIEKAEIRINAREAAKCLPQETPPATPPSSKIVEGMFGKKEKSAETDPASAHNFEEIAEAMYLHSLK
ncbi:transposase domain-containing protein, partial [Desulfuromonas acetexigens]